MAHTLPIPASAIKRAFERQTGLVPRAIVRLKAGVMNENYCVRVGAEEFVLRIYGRKAEPETRLERHMLRTLAADGFPCPHPIVGDGDTDVFLVSGRPAIAYPMLPGTQKKRGTPAILEDLGHLQGRILRIPAGFVGPDPVVPEGPVDAALEMPELFEDSIPLTSLKLKLVNKSVLLNANSLRAIYKPIIIPSLL
jgi:Ser/Thr protein kinase RdoA (MazF antagonist)